MLHTLARIKRRFHARAAKSALSLQATKRIVIGAAGICAPSWVATEERFLDLCSVEDWTHLAAPGSIAAILAEHVWEHLDAGAAEAAARQCFAQLRPGGHLRVAVPDGLHPDPAYIEAVRPGGTGAGAEDHKVLYRYDSLAALFQRAGFEVRPCEHFDAAGRFHFHDWDPRDGMVWRSLRYDQRNRDGKPNYSSIILDAVRPAETGSRDA